MNGEAYSLPADGQDLAHPDADGEIVAAGSYESSEYQASYTWSEFSRAYIGDMTYAGSDPNWEQFVESSFAGTTKYGDGTEVSKMTYTVYVQQYNVTVEYNSGLGGFTYEQPASETTMVYFLVRSPGNVVFRVLGLPSDSTSGLLIGNNYLTQLKVLSTESGSKGLCNGEAPATTKLSSTSNGFTGYDLNAYNTLVAANGWNLDTGGVITNGAASCFDNSYIQRRGRTIATSSETCHNNAVNIEEAKAACIGAMASNASLAHSSGMLDDCVHDWCTFGGKGRIVESYIMQHAIIQSLDSRYLVTNYILPVTQETKLQQKLAISPGNGYTCALFVADENMLEAWEMAYGLTISIVKILKLDETTIKYIYIAGCSVDFSSCTDVDSRRNTELLIDAQAKVTSSATNAVTTGVSSGSSFADNVNLVVASDPTKYASVPAASASSIGEIGLTSTVSATFAGGSFAPTSGSSSNQIYDLHLYLIICGCIGVLSLMIICVSIAMVNCRKKSQKKSQEETRGPRDPEVFCENFDEMQPPLSGTTADQLSTEAVSIEMKDAPVDDNASEPQL